MWKYERDLISDTIFVGTCMYVQEVHVGVYGPRQISVLKSIWSSYHSLFKCSRVVSLV